MNFLSITLFLVLMFNVPVFADNFTQSDLIDIKNYINSEQKRNEDRKSSAREAFQNAKTLINEGKIKEATLNFAIACNTDIEEAEYLEDYVDAIIDVAQNFANNGKPQEALQIIAEMEYFIYTNPQIIAPKNAKSAIILLNRLTKAADLERFAINSQSLDYDDKAVAVLIKNANAILNEDYNLSSLELEHYRFKIDAVAAKLVRLPENFQSDEVKKVILKLSQRYEEVALQIEAGKMFLKAEELLSQIKLQSDNIFVNSLLNELNGIIQRLLIFNTYEIKIRAVKLNAEYENLVNEFNASSSQKTFDKIKKRYESAEKRFIKNETKATKAIETLMKLNDELIIESSKVYDKNYLMQLKDLSYTINNEVEKWKTIQNKRYERWAVKVLSSFYDTYKGELGVLSASKDGQNRIYLGMKDYICKIEVRYLSHSSFKIYSEVFDLFYKELSRQDRLKISTDFITCEKKLLTEF